MNVLHPPPATTPRWLRLWAVLTVCATAVMLVLGAVVTTFRVGMADPVWPTYPWHLLLIDWQEPRPGFLIEHTHRLVGHLIGTCVIVLAVGLWLNGPRRGPRWLGLGGLAAMCVSLALGFWLKDTAFWLICPAVILVVLAWTGAIAFKRREPALGLAWLGTAVLAAVMVQGMLGGFRVRLNALFGTDLAVVHGCFAQVVFALLVGLAYLVHRPALPAPARVAPAEERSSRAAVLAVAALVFFQLVFGALLRHTEAPWWQRAHVLTAFAVVASVVWLGTTLARGPEGRLPFAVKLLLVLVAAQLLLGVESWMMRFTGAGLFALQTVTVGQAVIRTAHVLIGSWILATAVVVALRAHRRVALAVLAAAPEGRWEGAA
jgi:heme A synthase